MINIDGETNRVSQYQIKEIKSARIAVWANDSSLSLGQLAVMRSPMKI